MIGCRMPTNQQNRRNRSASQAYAAYPNHGQHLYGSLTSLSIPRIPLIAKLRHSRIDVLFLPEAVLPIARRVFRDSRSPGCDCQTRLELHLLLLNSVTAADILGPLVSQLEVLHN